MKRSLISIIIIFVALTISNAQEESNFGVKFSGFVKNDIIWDSRQGVSAREGHFYLYPMNENLDMRGEDINAKPNFNMLSIQTRLRALATGPDVWGAKSSAFVEGAFFGAVEGNINTFRLRHAFVKLAWPKTQLLVGQYWHPMFNVRCYPGTVSFNTGAPFQPFSRNPQVRLTQSFGKFNFTLTALAQRDFTSTGPNLEEDKPNVPSTVYLRNTGYPAINLRMEYFTKNDDNGNEFLMGFSFNYKALTPRIVTAEGYKTSETAMSGAFSGFIKYKSKDFTIQFNGYMGGDAYNLTMLGGYAVSDTSNASGKLEEYKCIRNLSLWTDMQTNGGQFQFGLFAGYSQNLGSPNDIAGSVYTRGADIDYLYRISPRLIYNSGKFRIAPEIEYTVAAYATSDENGVMNIDEKGKITDSKTVGNFRFLLGVYFFF